MSSEVYDLCIVGAGMFGSAAARHASANVGIKVCLVGPDEPTPEERETREIFSAHYDEGRITRMLGEDVLSQTLIKHSVSRYRELEKLSGIQFYHPIGFLSIGKKHSARMERIKEMASLTSLPVVDLSHNDIFKRRYPFIRLREDDQILMDDFGGGHISPRKMVEAQKKVAKCQGCDIINQVVDEVGPLVNGIHKVTCEDDVFIEAKRVLICTGAFTNLKKFPFPKLNITIEKETVAFLQLPPKEATRLSSMPSIIYCRPEEEIGAYILPPIQYPNGGYYLKIGHADFGPTADEVETLEEVRQWYLSKGDSTKIETLSRKLFNMLPGLICEEVSSMTCVTCSNSTGQPYIDRITPTITVAAVGNGGGAKLSDEVGRIAAMLSVTGKWESELSKSHFEAVFQD